jgi:hypothetical protein
VVRELVAAPVELTVGAAVLAADHGGAIPDRVGDRLEKVGEIEGHEHK